MNIEFLGTAGYHPGEMRHTSCAYIPNAAPDCAFVLDAGTGFFRLIGRPLPSQIKIFLSHAHLDHCIGVTFYLDLINSSATPCELTMYGSRECLDAVLGIFDSPLFPVAFNGQSVALEPGGVLDVNGVGVSVHPLTHPGGALAYRFDWPEKSLAYVTDTIGDECYLEFIQNVDLLIHERNFSNDLRDLAVLSGHCTTDDVIRVAQRAQPKHLALMHFNPLEEGELLDKDLLQRVFPNAVFARDGLVIEF